MCQTRSQSLAEKKSWNVEMITKSAELGKKVKEKEREKEERNSSTLNLSNYF